MDKDIRRFIGAYENFNKHKPNEPTNHGLLIPFVSIQRFELLLLLFSVHAGSLCLVYSRRESYLLNTNKARAHLYGGAPVSFQTEKYSGDRTRDL